MHCRRFQENFTDYDDGTLPAAEAELLRTHLAGCPDCQREWLAWQQFTAQVDTLAAVPVPSPRLREQFYAMLETHERDSHSTSPFGLARSALDRFFAALLPAQPSLQFAVALVLLLGGLFIGREFLASSANITPSDDPSKTEIAALRAQVNSMGRLVTHSLLQQQSTSERLRAVLATLDLKSPDRQVLTDLVGTLVFDPSVNVRLTTVDALAPHAHDSLVRAGVLSALPREPAPLVQIAMIELLADAGDPAARPVLEKLSRDAALDDNVRTAARQAIGYLPPNPKPFATPANAPL